MDFRRLSAAGNPSRNLIFYSLLRFTVALSLIIPYNILRMLLGFNDKKDSSGHSILPLTIKKTAF